MFWICFVVFVTLVFPINAEMTACPPVDPAHIDVFAQVGSDILLPCSFTTRQLQQATHDSSAVVWLMGEREYLVEITISGQPKFWKSYHNKYWTLTSATKGNFSLLLKNLDPNDSGEYNCILYEGEHCVVGHVVCKVQLVKSLWQNAIFVVALGSGCSILLLILILLPVCTVCNRRQNRSRNERKKKSKKYRKSPNVGGPVLEGIEGGALELSVQPWTQNFRNQSRDHPNLYDTITAVPGEEEEYQVYANVIYNL